MLFNKVINFMEISENEPTHVYTILYILKHVNESECRMRQIIYMCTMYTGRINLIISEACVGSVINNN